MRDVVVCDSVSVGILISTAMRNYRLISIGIFLVVFWVFQDDVPCVQKAGNISETAESEVDERVSGTYSDFDPDCFP